MTDAESIDESCDDVFEKDVLLSEGSNEFSVNALTGSTQPSYHNVLL